MNRRVGWCFLAAASLAALSISPGMAGKTPDVIAKSNGFPSGVHFNLNIHGRDFSSGEPCAPEPGGNSVFVDLFGASTIEYQSDAKGAETVLTVVDPCASDDGKVSVKLPRQVTVVLDEATGESVTVPVDGCQGSHHGLPLVHIPAPRVSGWKLGQRIG